MNVAVGLIEGRSFIDAELSGTFVDPKGVPHPPGRRRFDSEITLTPSDPQQCAFAIDDVTIGIGFHWERKERHATTDSLKLSHTDEHLAKNRSAETPGVALAAAATAPAPVPANVMAMAPDLKLKK